MRASALIAGSSAAVWTAAHLRAPSVGTWRASDLPLRSSTELTYRIDGPPRSGRTIVLLHGLVATGDVFGSLPDMLATDGRVVVPDLLGFGRSLDESRTDFSTDAHLDALDDMIQHTGEHGRLTIVAHSMGSALALRWAARSPLLVDRVVCIGAPVWRTPAAARAGLSNLGGMSLAFLLDERVAGRLCEFNCRHRKLAGILAAIVAPRWPVPVARQASLHTWPAYHQTLIGQVIDCPWERLVDEVASREIPVTFVRGDADDVGDRQFAEALARRFPNVDLDIVAGDHSLPASHPVTLRELVG